MADGAAARAAVIAAPIVKAKLGRDEGLMRAGLLVMGLYLVVALAVPLWVLLSKSLESSLAASP